MNKLHQDIIDRVDLELRASIKSSQLASSELMHYESVLRHAKELCENRHLNAYLASLIAMLHDYGRIKTGTNEKHAKAGAKLSEKLLNELGTSDEEIDVITRAISNHGKKKLIQDMYSELIKDADALSHKEMKLELKAEEVIRIRYAYEDGKSIKWNNLNIHRIIQSVQNALEDLLDGKMTNEAVHEIRINIRKLLSLIWLLEHGDLGLSMIEIREIKRSLKSFFKYFNKPREYYVLKKQMAVLEAVKVKEYAKDKLKESKKKLRSCLTREVIETLYSDIKRLDELYEKVNFDHISILSVMDAYIDIVSKLDVDHEDSLHHFRIEGKIFKYLHELGLVSLHEETYLLIKSLHHHLGDWHDAQVNRTIIKAWKKDGKVKISDKDYKTIKEGLKNISEDQINHIKTSIFEMKHLLKLREVGMAKRICKMAKDKIDKEYLEMVNKPKVICMKCGRVSNKKAFVCKPKKFDEFDV